MTAHKKTHKKTGQTQYCSRSESRQGQTATCSMCGKVYQLENAQHRPFCSSRCQMIDLSGWLDESYGLPVEDASQPDYSDVASEEWE